MKRLMPLTLIHRPRDASGAGWSAARVAQLSAQGFYAATCMREVVLMPTVVCNDELRADASLTVLRDADAYAFLLRTVTGLNSSVPGETNVQGQLRKAWELWRAGADAHLVMALSPTVHSIFNAARDIRRDYLQGIGGSSYGSLVRKLLQPTAKERILLVGAGDLARSVLPFFTSFATGIWNRHLPDNDMAPAAQRFDQRESAARWASQVIMTTPPETPHDDVWAELCRTANVPVVHLGRRRAAPGSWAQLPQFYSLDDVFDLRRSQSSLRSLQIVRASSACERQADALYALDTPQSVPRLTAARA